MNDMDFWFERGHVAIVTGASKGFGFAVAELLARRGISLVVTARRESELLDAAARLRAYGGVEAIAGDVRDPAHTDALVLVARERFGRLDLVVNNASSLGESPLPRLDAISARALAEAFETNAFAPLRLMQAAVSDLVRAGGTIVNVTSDAATHAYATWGGYGASKAALEHLTRTFAAEYDGFPVSFVVADPGNLDTELHALAEPGEDLSSLPKPEDVAPALLRVLAGTRSAYVRAELQALTVIA